MFTDKNYLHLAGAICLLLLLNDMTAEQWQHLQTGLAGQLQEKDTNLRIKSQRFWSAI